MAKSDLKRVLAFIKGELAAALLTPDEYMTLLVERYCGHDTCHAFASWTPLQPLNVTHIGKSTPARNSWDNREESTWIDKL